MVSIEETMLSFFWVQKATTTSSSMASISMFTLIV